MYESRVIGILNGGLYKLYLNESISFQIESKESVSFDILLHKTLGHIS